jgi:hypothetical protein
MLAITLEFIAPIVESNDTTPESVRYWNDV